MASEQLTAAEAAASVWRVGFQPEPWAWSGWEWATDGRFPGRRDDLHGNFRTIYAGSSLLACLLEVLAGFRYDARLSMELGEIIEDDEDKVLHPTIPPGQVPKEWLDERGAASAELSGRYCAVTASGSVAALYPHFIGVALSLGLADFDAAALKDARPTKRGLSPPRLRQITFSGVEFCDCGRQGRGESAPQCVRGKRHTGAAVQFVRSPHQVGAARCQHGTLRCSQQGRRARQKSQLQEALRTRFATKAPR